MYELAKQVALTRGAQLLARYIGAGLVWLSGYLGVATEVANAENASHAGAILIIAGVFFALDMIIHAVRGKEDAAKTNAAGPKASAVILLAALPACLMFSGCMGTKPPEAIAEAQDLKTQSIRAYAANMELIVESILGAYKQEAYGAIDALFEADLEAARAKAKAAGGNIDFDVAVEGMRALLAKKEAKRREVDAAIAEIRGVLKGAQVELEIGLRLDEALARYQQAGIDISVARSAADQILNLVKLRK